MIVDADSSTTAEPVDFIEDEDPQWFGNADGDIEGVTDWPEDEDDNN